jgi:hypothetical protein
MTAVQWFNEEINKLNVGNDARVFITKLFEQAKEMEKQQIIDAYKDSTSQFSVDARIDYPKSAEQYYNEQFKNK